MARTSAISAADVHVVPIRHHSPSCAWHLRALLDEVSPALLLIEGPDDYDPLIPLIVDPETRTPVAVVSILEGKSRGATYFPFCAHSPEYVALTEAAARGIPARFIDLPATDKAMLRDGEDQPDAGSLLALDEQHFDSGDYVRALADRMGCRDGNEVWDHLFESRIGGGDWRRFFADVGQYCAHIRESTAASTMAADGTIEREEHMVAHIAAARRAGAGPIVVLVGGFHMPALEAALASCDQPPVPGRPPAGRQPYLIRYGYRQLNGLTGYGAGLPLPAYYERLWRVTDACADAPFDQVAHDLLGEFAAHLRAGLPTLGLSVPALVTALEGAHRLAALRGRPGPLRDDLLDACRSTFVKGEDSGDTSPVMAELAAFLTGSAIGEVPASAGSPPLVEAVRDRARSVGLRLDDGERRTRELDIYRRPRHRDASRFLHAMVFLDTGLGQRTGGPDFRTGVDLDRLIEHWSIMWSPLFEARLIERAADGDTVEEALAAELARRLADLETQGLAGKAAIAIALFATACQAGIADHARSVLPVIESDITRDVDLASVVGALRDLVGLWRGRVALGFSDDTPLAALIATAWRRAIYLLPDLVNAGEERIATTLEAMAVMHEVVGLADDAVPMIDTALFDEGIGHLLDAPLDPALAGAVAALALLGGRLDDTGFAGRLSGELKGAYTDAACRIAWLRGVIAISRELLWRVPQLVDAADQVLEDANDADFVALLPHLRMAFSALDPREIDRLAQSVARRHDGNVADLVARHELSAAEMDANLRADGLVRDMLAAEGLL